MAYDDVKLREQLQRELFQLSGLGRPEKINEPSGLYAQYGKRLFDVVFALILLPFLLPLIVLIWAVIRADGGPGLFIQPRVGRNGRIFSCYKFRTMVEGAEAVLDRMCAADPAIALEWNTFQKLSGDPRITRIGNILRITSLDELPQLFNVLLGDMSFVGPRPFLPAQRKIYDASGGRAYYRMRPGVTGLWQVLSRRDTTLSTRVRFDEAYGENLSFLADLSLILRTSKVLVRGTGT